MNKVRAVLKVIDNVSERSGQICQWLVVPLGIIVVFEVICRRVFNSPNIWTFEISNMLAGAFFMLAVAYVLLHKKHVAVDIVYSRLSARRRAILDIITYPIFLLLFSAVLFWVGCRFAGFSWSITEKSWSQWAPYMFPIKTVIPIAFLLLLLQGLSVFVKNIIFVAKGVKL